MLCVKYTGKDAILSAVSFPLYDVQAEHPLCIGTHFHHVGSYFIHVERYNEEFFNCSNVNDFLYSKTND